MNADKFKTILLDYSKVTKKHASSYFKNLLHPRTPKKASIMWALNTFVLPIALTIIVTVLLSPFMLITGNTMIWFSFILLLYIYAILSFFLLPLYYLLKHLIKETERKELEKLEQEEQLFEKLGPHRETLKNFALKYYKVAPSRTIKKTSLQPNLNDLDFLESFGEVSRDFDNTFLQHLTSNNVAIEAEDLSELRLVIDSQNLEKLVDLLQSKYDIVISANELVAILPEYYRKFKAEEFEEIFSKQKEEYSKYLEHYVNYFGEKCSNRVNFVMFSEFLREKKLFPRDIAEKPVFEQTKKIAEDVITHIRKQELNMFENQLRSRVSISDMDKMDGKKFEKAAENIFTSQGYKTIRTTYSNDQGADLILERFGKKIAVQAKRYSGKVPNKAIQEIVTAKQYYDCDEAWIVTNSYLTKPAKKLAKKNKVEIIERNKLEKML